MAYLNTTDLNLLATELVKLDESAITIDGVVTLYTDGDTIPIRVEWLADENKHALVIAD